MEFEVHKVPVRDTGLGREAGYRDDAELVAAAKARRKELEGTLTPEALAKLDAAEAAIRAQVDRSIYGFSATLNGQRVDPRRISASP
jgi:hypothetical protein